MYSASKFLSNPTKKNLIYNKYKSFIDNSKKENKNKIKSYIYLMKKDQVNFLENSIIRNNSKNNIQENNNENDNNNPNNLNRNINHLQKAQKKNLSHQLHSKGIFQIYNSKLFFDTLNKIKKEKEKNNAFTNRNNINLKNILNNSISLLNENHFKSKNSQDNIDKSKSIISTLKKIENEKKFLKSQSNIYKIEYIKKMVRKHYFEKFDNLKQFFKYINLNSNNKNYLTLEDFVFYLKEILKVDIDKKEIRYLLNANGIIKIDYCDFKYIFFPEQINKKNLNLKLKNNLYVNEKNKSNNYNSSQSKFLNNEKIPFIEKRVFSIPNIHNITTKIVEKLSLNKVYNKNNNLYIDVNKDYNNIVLEKNRDNQNSKLINNNKKINDILTFYKSIINYNNNINSKNNNESNSYETNLMKINGINNLNNINKSNPIKNDINIDLNKKNINEINNSNLKNNNLYNITNINKGKEYKLNNLIKNTKKNNKLNTLVDYMNKIENEKSIEINNILNKENKNKINNINCIYNKHKNKTISVDNYSKSSFREIINPPIKSNSKLFFINEKNKNLMEFEKSNMSVDSPNKKKNLDIIGIL